jgi:hypothetical protein
VAACARLAFLSDVGRVAQKDLDIAEYTDHANNPMIPQVIVPATWAGGLYDL